MTDPTTRYPLPDEPVADAAPIDPVAAPTPPPADPPSAPPEARPAPAWTPPRHEEGRWPAIIFGLILLGVGLWFFIEVTLGIDLPTIRWGQLWPLILIGIGVLILYGARIGRRR